MLNASVYQSFFEKFQGNRNVYGIQRYDAVKKQIYYLRVDKPLKLEDYIRHVEGQCALGIYPLLEDHCTCLFAVLDLDTNNYELVARIAKLLPQPNYIERSRTGNHHIWLFFDEKIAISRVHHFCQTGLAYAKVHINDHCAIYPSLPNNTTDVGLMIALPYQGELTAAQKTVLLNDSGNAYTLTEAASLTPLYVGSLLEQLAQEHPTDELQQLLTQDKKLRVLWSGSGGKPGKDKSQSAYDFAFALALLRAHYDQAVVIDWLQQRPKVHSREFSYLQRTVQAAAERILGKRALEQTTGKETTTEQQDNVRKWTDIEPLTRDQFFNALDQELVLGPNQKQHFDIFMAAIVGTLKTEGRPLWVLFVGPPGSGKTLPMLAAQYAPCTYACSAFRPTSLISGWGLKGGEDMSLLPRLDGRILMVKDMSSLLTQNKDLVLEVFGLLRDIYDGSCTKVFGTGVERTYAVRFGFLGAATPDIDASWALNQRLGERFLRYRVRASLEEVYAKIDHTLANVGNENQQDALIETATLGYLRYLLDTNTKLWPQMSNPKRIGRLAQLGAILRTSVNRTQRNNQVAVLPEWEEATRYGKQLLKMALALAYVRGKEADDDEEFEDIKTLVRDGLDARFERIYRVIAQHPAIETGEIAQYLSLSEYNVRHCLEDLQVSRIVVGTRNNYTLHWDFVPFIRGQVEAFHLWDEKGTE